MLGLPKLPGSPRPPKKTFTSSWTISKLTSQISRASSQTTSQITDTSRGIIKRINYFSPIDENRLLKDKLWGDLFKDYKILKSTYPSNYSALFTKLSYSIEKYKIEKTNLVKLARINRKAVADAKYNL